MARATAAFTCAAMTPAGRCTSCLAVEGGGWTKTVLYNFGNGTDGSGPDGLIMDAAGNLYGVTSFGRPLRRRNRLRVVAQPGRRLDGNGSVQL